MFHSLKHSLSAAAGRGAQLNHYRGSREDTTAVARSRGTAATGHNHRLRKLVKKLLLGSAGSATARRGADVDGSRVIGQRVEGHRNSLGLQGGDICRGKASHLVAAAGSHDHLLADYHRR